MTWDHLQSRLVNAGLLIHADRSMDHTTITGISQDSRKIQPGHVFVSIHGHAEHGSSYIHHALDAGAAIIVSEDERNDIPNLVHVTHARKASAVIAAAFYHDPGNSLHLTGVTGTNGKTTTATVLHHVFESTGTPTGLIGTVTCRTGQATYTSHLTTPDATELQPMLAEMVQSDCKACVIEVSSHALDQYRTGTLHFSTAIFTNLKQDHLDYHQTFEHYLSSKKRLFDGLPRHATAVYNQDDPAGDQIVKDTRAKKCSFGQNTKADIQFRIVEDSPRGLMLNLDGQTCQCRLAGTFNAYNLAAAYSAARVTGLGASDVINALSTAPPVSGRYEQYQCNDQTRIIIDYAHTPDALEQVLKSLHTSRRHPSQIWCLFGCGGNRDRLKRPLMGAIAENLADHVVITKDNPRRESAHSITQEILGGMQSPQHAHQIPCRSEAVRFVAQSCHPGDIVLLAGKGHEPAQFEHESSITMSDQQLVLDAFSAVSPAQLN